MPVYRNRNFEKRNYDCTNIVAVECAEPPLVGWNGQPADYWEPTTGRPQLAGLDKIGSFAGMTFYGYL